MAELPDEATREGRKCYGYEANSGNLAGVQILRELTAIYPGSAKQFKRRVRTATDGDVRSFDQGYSGIKNRFRQAAEIRRGIDPLQTGRVKPIAAHPSLHRDH